MKGLGKTFCAIAAIAALLAFVQCSQPSDQGAFDEGSACHLINPVSGSHQIHLAEGINLTCDSCHPEPGKGADTVHNNGTVDLTFSGTYTNGTCTNVACHADAEKRAAKVNAPMVWRWNASKQCADCHDNPAFSMGAHQKHVDSASYHIACATCHTGIAALGHNNGGLTVSAQGMSFQNRTCTNIGCHLPEESDMEDIAWNASAAWDSTFTCQSCHNTQTNSHGYGMTQCNACHDGVVDENSAIVEYQDHIPAVF